MDTQQSASQIAALTAIAAVQAELREVRLTGYWNIMSNCIFAGGPILISLASFTIYIVLGHDLTPDVAFPALALFNLLRFPVLMCAWFPVFSSPRQACPLDIAHSETGPA